MKQRWYNVISTLKQRWKDVVQRWKTVVPTSCNFSSTLDECHFNVIWTLFQRGSTTFKQRWSDLEMLARMVFLHLTGGALINTSVATRWGYHGWIPIAFILTYKKSNFFHEFILCIENWFFNGVSMCFW